MALLGREKALRKLESALRNCPAEAAEAVLMGGESDFTRYANSEIHQNTSESNATIFIRAAVGRRLGVVTTNRLDEEGLKEAARLAAEVASSSPEVPEFPGFPRRGGRTRRRRSFYPETIAFGPDLRAEAVARIVQILDAAGARGAGVVSREVLEFAVANTSGLRRYHAVTFASCSVVAERDGSYGRAEACSMNAASLEVEEVARRALAICLKSEDPVDLEPGEYDVILMPGAVAELLSTLGWMGLGAKRVEEGESFVLDWLGRKLAPDFINLVDDVGLRPLPFVPFDFEGVAKRRVHLIEAGVVRGVVYDTITARRAGTESTGHAMPPGSLHGPIPTHLALLPGEAPLRRLVSETRLGLLVNRVHYVIPVDYRRTLVTGMTRFGTFLVEGGKVRRAVRNMRFTESIIGALSRAEAVSREAEVYAEGPFFAVLAPALKVKGFKFVGRSEEEKISST